MIQYQSDDEGIQVQSDDDGIQVIFSDDSQEMAPINHKDYSENLQIDYEIED